MALFRFRPRGIIFGFRQTAAATAAAAALTASATRSAPAPVSALIAALVAAIRSAITASIAASVTAPFSALVVSPVWEAGGSLHGARRGREGRRGRGRRDGRLHSVSCLGRYRRGLRRRFRGHRRHRRNRHAVQFQNLLLHRRDNFVVFVVVLEEVRNVEERVAAQADIDERRLHARKHARHSTFVDGTR